MTENQKSSEIAAHHKKLFRHNLEKYLNVRQSHPYEELNKCRIFMFKLGLLTEIWVTIEKLMKEKYYDRARKGADKNSGGVGDSEREGGSAE